jgi:serine/threonine protein phosphatase PrpC
MLEQEQPGLAPGVVIDGRLRILKSEITADGYFLEVEDLLCCWNCQAVQSELSLRFCENCGAELQPRPTRRLQVWQLDEIATLPDEPAGEWLDAGGYRFVFQPIEQPASPATPQVHLRLGAGYRSDTGMERDIDEDSLLVLNLAAVCEMSGAPMLGFYAVADGIGGNDAGEVASRIAVHALAAGVLERLFLPQLTDSPLTTEQMTAELKQIVLQANQAILSMRNQSSEHTNMGSTLTAALIHNQQAIVVNVGDSRTYLMREGHLSQVTSDHSLVARLAAQGVISPQEIYTHEQRSVIYRSLGDRGNVEIDLFEIDLQAGDRLLLCSDGLWEMVRDPLIEEVLLERFDPQQACNRLVELANLGGGDDNISVIVVDVQPL